MPNDTPKLLATVVLTASGAAMGVPVATEIMDARCIESAATEVCAPASDHYADENQRQPQRAVVAPTVAAVNSGGPMPFNNSAMNFVPPQQYRDPNLGSWVQGPSLGLVVSASQTG